MRLKEPIKSFFPLILILMSMGALHGQSSEAVRAAREGDAAYDSEEYEKALQHYEKAWDIGMRHPELQFNIGNSLYKQEKYADAAKEFEQLTHGSPDPELKADAYHNLGNSHLVKGKLDKSIEAYKEALRMDPADEDSRYNLTLAKKLKKKEEQKEKDQKDKKEQEEQNKKQDKKGDQDKEDGEKGGDGDDKNKKEEKKKKEGDRDQQKGEKGEEEKEKEKEQGQQGNKGDKKEKEKKGEERQLSQQEIKRLLDAMEADEKRIIRKILKNKERKEGKSRDVEKDW